MRFKIFLLALLLIILAFIASFYFLNGQADDQDDYRHKTYSFKKFPVLEYHLIGRPESRWTRTPENFRKDLEWLYQNDYYPMNLRDILTGFKGLPEGKTPVVLTFDDSSSSQFRILEDGRLDPDCAVNILRRFHLEHKSDWPMRATFFVLIQTNGRDRNIFGQPDHPEYKEIKLRQLDRWGCEVGSHTYSHERLNKLTPKAARYALARSYLKLKEMSWQDIVSLATPMGLYPEDESVFSGQYQKIKYDYKLVCEVAGGLNYAPNNPKFNPHHINRIQTIWPEWQKFFGRRPIK